MRVSLAASAGAVLTTLATAALAEPAPLALCTAARDGAYHAAGEDLAKGADPSHLEIQVVETEGSMDNLKRLARDACGAAIVQSDAYLVYQEVHEDQPLAIARNRFLYAEYAHLVCRRDAGVGSSADLLERQPRVLVGRDGSGGSLSWLALRYLDARYREVPTEPVGGTAALRQVLAGDADCLFFVAGLGSGFARQVDREGEALQLVGIVGERLEGAEIGGARLYETRRIPAGTYGALQAGLTAGTETLTVGATLTVSGAWSARYPNGGAALMRALEHAGPAIRERAVARR